MKIEGHGSPATAGLKEWSWSYSKLKNYETCPKRMYEIDLAKNYSEPQDPNGPLAWGNRLHDEFAKALKNSTALPPEMASYETWMDRVRRGNGELLVEQKFAINRRMEKTAYFAKDVWYRGIGDVVRIDNDLGLVLDWKSGKIVEDSVQLMLMAQCLFSHYPALKYVRSEFVWLKEECTTPELLSRTEVADAWVDLLPRVQAMEAANKNQNYPPKPNGLCKNHCVVASCPFYKKGGR